MYGRPGLGRPFIMTMEGTMKFKSIELSNYIGIYNGMGLKRIYVDFTKCLHHLIIIKGDNGSGKSTLFNALSILPDSNDCFIIGLEARKKVEILDGDILYQILYTHTPTNKDTFTTKGFFYKIVDGTTIDMNPLGSITSCKDIIFNEFNLDYNFETLTKLSSSEKGLANKKPAERKQFVTKITASLDVYNSMNKTLRQRYTSVKTMVNSITQKLKAIGNIQVLQSGINSITKRIIDMKAARDNLVDYRATKKFIIDTLDPTGSILNTYNISSMKLNTLSSKKQQMLEKLTSAYHTTHLDESNTSDEYLKFINDEKRKIQYELSTIESSMARFLSEREEENRQLQVKIARLNSLTSQSNYEDLRNIIDTTLNKISSYEEFFKEAGITDTSITKEEYISGANTLMTIKELVDAFKGLTSYDTMQYVLDTFVLTNTYPDIRTLEDQINGLEESISRMKEERGYFISQSEIAQKLKNRPEDCKINDCFFITDAYQASLKNPEEKVLNLTTDIDGSMDILGKVKDQLSELSLYIECINHFKTLFRYIENNSYILSKLPNGAIYSDKDLFARALIDGYTFDDIYVINSYISKASIFEDYKKSQEDLKRLYADLEVFESKNAIIVEITDDINSISNKIDSITEKLDSISNSKIELNNLLSEYTSTEINIKSVLEIKEQLLSIEGEESETNNSLQSIADSISQINNANQELLRVNAEIERYNHDIEVLEADREKMRYGITEYESYQEELSRYMAKYKKIEVLKKYSSPSQEGIQLIFIELYMGTIVEICNSLLQYVLGGEYHLLKPIINESEFRMPIQGEGYLNDDISSLSDGQASLVGTIVNAALLYQSSTKYNIPKYDEVDAALDSTNRAQFPILLDQLREILHYEQCIMISHNNEISLNNADLIVLKNSDPTDLNESSGNIIFQY